MAYYFNGSTYCRVTGGKIASQQPTAYTQSVWAKVLDTSTRTIFTRSDGNRTNSFSHDINYNGSAYYGWVWDGATKGATATITSSVGQWAHVAVTAVNGGVLTIYINGVACGTSSTLGTMWNLGNDWWICANNGSTTYGYYHLAELAIWNAALTAAQIKALAQPVRYLPLQFQRSSLVMYWPMLAGDNQVFTGDVSDFSYEPGYSQTWTGNPVGVADIFAMP